MATISRFEDLEIWQLARKICKKLHVILEAKKEFKDYGLKTQIFNSSGSCMDNIAEGFERNGRKEFKQFLSIAKGSAGEVRSQLYRLHDSNALTQLEFDELYSDTISMSKKISSFIDYLKKSELKGTKFCEPEVEYQVLENLEH